MVEDELYTKFPYNENNCWDILPKIEQLEPVWIPVSEKPSI
jgi:hypothetical protein